jgi:hypothetical protein
MKQFVLALQGEQGPAGKDGRNGEPGPVVSNQP